MKTIQGNNRRAVEIKNDNYGFTCYYFINYSQKLLSCTKSSKTFKSLKAAEKSANDFIK